MKITRDVIKDLMPLYFANEVSDDTRILVDEFIKENPEFFEKYKIKYNDFSKVPETLKKEDQLEAFLKVKKLQMIRTIILSVVISVGVLGLISLIAVIIKLG
jgi:hypothetical protein